VILTNDTIGSTRHGLRPRLDYEPPVGCLWPTGRPHPRRVDDEGMSEEREVGPAASVPPGTVVGVGNYAVGNSNGELFAVSRRCRHLGADLANGSIDEQSPCWRSWSRYRSARGCLTGLTPSADRS
jgi:hypothetical protein